MGHRLSCHKGDCKNFHGHNYRLLIGVKSEILNNDGMVIDFSHLKSIVKGFIEIFDHALMVNEIDAGIVKKIKDVIPFMKVIEVPYEPTAENMAKEIFENVGKALRDLHNIEIDFVTLYETDTSYATYSVE